MWFYGRNKAKQQPAAKESAPVHAPALVTEEKRVAPLGPPTLATLIKEESSALERIDGPEEKKEKGYKRLTLNQLNAVLSLRNEGRTQQDIASILGCHQSTVGNALRKLGVDTTQLAKNKAKVKALSAVKRLDSITQHGKDNIAVKAASKLLEVAELTGSAASKQNDVRVGVQVVIGMPGQPAGPDPMSLSYIKTQGQVVDAEEVRSTD